jgi:hypothetical protein
MKNVSSNLQKVNVHHTTLQEINILHTLAFVFPSHGLLKSKENVKSFYLELQCRTFACPNSNRLTEKFQVLYESSEIHCVFLVASPEHH